MGFLPLGDDNRFRHRPPVVVGSLVLANLAVWLAQLGLGEAATMGYAAVPYEIVNHVDLTREAPLALQAVQIDGRLHPVPQYPGPTPIHLTLLTSMFMHGGWLHLLGNLLYLWIFGDQIEDLLGHARFIAFYLTCGLIAALAQVVVDPTSIIPCVGASGAIAGVLGAYLVSFPLNRVYVLVGIWLVSLPAMLVLGGWIALQLLDHMNSLAVQSAGGVAYAAHIAGFVAGMLLVMVFGGTGRRQRAAARVNPR
jgi:membrane associated rhomboid family serine protease